MRGVSARFMLIAVVAVAAAYFLRTRGGGTIDADALARYGVLVRVGLFAAATLVAAGTVRSVASVVGMGVIVLVCGSAFEFTQPGGTPPAMAEIAFSAVGAALGVVIRAGGLLLTSRRAEAALRDHVVGAFEDALESEATGEEALDAARRAYRAAEPDAGDAEIAAALERWFSRPGP